MATSSNGNIFRATGPLRGKFTGHRWIPHREASDEELWCFLWSMHEPKVEQANEKPVIYDAIAVIMTSLQCSRAHLFTRCTIKRYIMRYFMQFIFVALGQIRRPGIQLWSVCCVYCWWICNKSILPQLIYVEQSPCLVYGRLQASKWLPGTKSTIVL